MTTAYIHCACKHEIKRLEDEKEDILDALLLARDMLGEHYRCSSIPMVMLDRVIKNHTEGSEMGGERMRQLR